MEYQVGVVFVNFRLPLQRTVLQCYPVFSAKFNNMDKQIKVIFEALNQVMALPASSKKIGFLK